VCLCFSVCVCLSVCLCVSLCLCLSVCLCLNRHQDRSKVTSAQSVQQHQTELEMNQEELADTLGGGKRLLL
jgi:hypothetical protein